MKYLLLVSFLISPFAFAQTYYEIPHVASATGTLKFEKTNKGLVMHYPENIKVQKVGVFHQDAMISESYCNKVLPSLVSSSLSTKDTSMLYTSYPTQVIFSSFPFQGLNFEEYVYAELKKQGLQEIHFKYPIVSPQILSFEMLPSQSALSNKLPNITLSEQYKYQIIENSGDVRIQTNYLPFICDVLTKATSMKLDWSLEVMPFEKDYKEYFSRKQVEGIYNSAKDLSKVIEAGASNNHLDTEKSFFLLGAAMGASFQKQVGNLSKENVAHFTSLSMKLTDRREAKLKELSVKELGQVYNNMLIDVTKPAKFKGATYAN